VGKPVCPWRRRLTSLLGPRLWLDLRVSAQWRHDAEQVHRNVHCHLQPYCRWQGCSAHHLPALRRDRQGSLRRDAHPVCALRWLCRHRLSPIASNQHTRSRGFVSHGFLRDASLLAAAVILNELSQRKRKVDHSNRCLYIYLHGVTSRWYLAGEGEVTKFRGGRAMPASPPPGLSLSSVPGCGQFGQPQMVTDIQDFDAPD